jgi:hypothetical protein
MQRLFQGQGVTLIRQLMEERIMEKTGGVRGMMVKGMGKEG